MNQRYVRVLAWASLITGLLIGPCSAQKAALRGSASASASGGGGGTLLPSDYALGAGDQITISALDAEEISGTPILIGSSGNIDVPLVGRMHVAGLTVEQLQEELKNRLKKYIKDPQLSVGVTGLRSQPVSIIGAVSSPGVHQLEGRKTLIEMLSIAGGVKAEAGYQVKITRQIEWGPIPLPSAKPDPSGRFSIAEVGLRDITEAKDPEHNILILPHDIISVPRAEMVYVIGDVTKGGTIVLGDQKEVSVLQALSMAGGLGKTAKPRDAKILRPVAGSATRVEVPVNLKALLAGKGTDISMHPEDILFVPTSGSKSFVVQTVQAALGSSLGAIIYRIP